MLPVLLPSLQKDAPICNHDALTADHLGTQKTLNTYIMVHFGLIWPEMLKILQTVSHLSTIKAHLSMPQCGPLQNIPVKQPWQMIAVDILKVVLLTKNNHYL